MDRGQAHTLEGFVAAMLLVSGVVFALQATAVTPLSASTSNQHIENQQRATAEDLLATATANGTLRPTLLFWNTSRNAFNASPSDGTYSAGGPPTAFGRSLNDTFGDQRIAFNVEIGHRNRNGSRSTQVMVDMGTPTDSAVVARVNVPIFDDARVGSTNVSAAAANDEFYAVDADPDGPLFNVMEVRIVVWRI